MFQVGQKVSTHYADGELIGEIISRVCGRFIVELRPPHLSGFFVTRTEYELWAAS